MDARMLSVLVPAIVCALVALYFVIRTKETAGDLSRAAGEVAG